MMNETVDFLNLEIVVGSATVRLTRRPPAAEVLCEPPPTNTLPVRLIPVYWLPLILRRRRNCRRRHLERPTNRLVSSSNILPVSSIV
jgi:hypothetical protein